MSKAERLRRLVKLMFAMKRVLHERLGRRNFRLDPSTLPRLAVLGYVREQGNPTMKELAEFLRIMPPSVTALTDGLVAAKFLERHADPGDRRSIRVRLTPKGKKFVEERFRAVDGEMSKMFARLTSKEQDTLIRLFEKLLV